MSEEAGGMLSGQRALGAAFGLFLTAVVSFVVVIAYSALAPDPSPPGVMGDYESPRSIPMTRPGVAGPAVTEVGMIIIRGRRCISASHDVTVQQFVTYREIPESNEGPERSKAVPDGSYGDEVARAGGCVVQDLLLALPAAVTPGRWYLDVIEIAVSTGEIRRWTSEPFTVVGRGP